MSDATNYLQEQLILWLTDNQDFDPSPTNIYVALHSADPGTSGENNEISAGGYSRKQTTPSDWNQPATGEFENAVDLLFPEATEDWGDVTHFSLWGGPDATDNSIAADSLFETVTIDTGDSPVFRDGQLTGTFE